MRLSKIMGGLRTGNHIKSHYKKWEKEAKLKNFPSVLDYISDKYEKNN